MEKDNLPEEVQAALSDPANFNAVCKIAEDFKIEGRNGEGTEKLDTIFERVFTGKLPFYNVAEEIKKEFGFSEGLSGDITNEMDVKIFSKYKESLKEIYPGSEEKIKIKEEVEKEREEAPVGHAEEIPKEFKPIEEKEERPPLEQELLRELAKPEEEEVPLQEKATEKNADT